VFQKIMADVDRFKKFNDTHGHPTGDEMLRGFARLLRRKMREMDMVGYYAPGCFALLLPTAGLANAIRVGERLRAEFSQYGTSVQGEPTKRALSVGVAQVMERDDSIGLLKRPSMPRTAAEAIGPTITTASGVRRSQRSRSRSAPKRRPARKPVERAAAGVFPALCRAVKNPSGGVHRFSPRWSNW
jgi:hypothetical protein